MRALWWAVIVLPVGLACWFGAAALRPVPPPRDIALAVQPLPQAPLRVVAFGTSLTANATWPDALRRALATCFSQAPVIVRVAGAGMGSDWAIGQTGAVIAAAPDIVLIEFAINDADLRDGLSLAQSQHNHLALIAAIRAARPHARIVLMTMNPAQGLRGWLRPRLAAYYAAYADLAVQSGVGLLDLYPRWLSRPRGDRGLQADGLHPDMALAEAVIVPPLRAYLAAAQGRRCP